MPDFLELYTRYYRQVYAWCMALCHDPHQAQDLTQEAFCRAMQAMGSFRGDCTVATWLRGIAKNCYREQQRRQESTAAQLPEMADPGRGPEQSLCDGDGAVAVYRILHRLSQPYQEVFYLRVCGELSFADIGRIFEMSPNWARVTFYRARQKIAERMSRDGSSEL